MQEVHGVVQSLVLVAVVSVSLKKFSRTFDNGLLGVNNILWDFGLVQFENGRSIQVPPIFLVIVRGGWERTHGHSLKKALNDINEQELSLSVRYRAKIGALAYTA